MNAALERFCFPVEVKLLESELLRQDVSKDSVKFRYDQTVKENLSVTVSIVIYILSIGVVIQREIHDHQR